VTQAEWIAQRTAIDTRPFEERSSSRVRWGAYRAKEAWAHGLMVGRCDQRIAAVCLYVTIWHRHLWVIWERWS
jgi:hypothetical protein